MFRTALVSAALVLVTSFASAQTIERSVDLSSLGWGRISAEPVETDGNLFTEEWLVRQLGNPNMLRVVAVRATGFCPGAWFNPVATRPNPSSFKLDRIGVVHKLRVFDFLDEEHFDIVRLDTPACAQ